MADAGTNSGVQQVDYEIRRFDSTESVEPLLREKTEQERRSRMIAPSGFRLEAVTLFNSNVAPTAVQTEVNGSSPILLNGMSVPTENSIRPNSGRFRAISIVVRAS